MPALVSVIPTNSGRTYNMRSFVYLAACVAALCMAASAQDQGAQSVVLSGGKSAKHPVHIVAKKTGTAKQGPINAASSAPTCLDSTGLNPGPCSFQYYGGPVISNADVVVVYWKSTASTTAVNCGGGTDSHGNCIGVSRFLSALSGSTFVDMLQEYNTVGISPTGGQGGTDQTIGRGTLHAGSPFVITPSAANSGSPINDTQIQNELQLQIDAGTLPKPATDSAGNVNTLYFVYFPPNLVISDPNIGTSCVAGGFCAYHGTHAPRMNTNDLPFPYGVMPDFGPGSGCDLPGACGSGTQFQNITNVSSHEYAESTTDTGVGLALNNAPPLGWYDLNNGEIGDPCFQADTIKFDSVTYAIQQIFSQKAYNANANAGCVAPGALTFTLTAPASSSAGTAFDVTVQVANSDASTYVGTVHFTSSDSAATLPNDYAFTTADAGTHKFVGEAILHTSGSQTITAADAHQPSTAGKATVTVSSGTKTSTTTTLSSSTNPSTYRQQVTFTAVVTATSGSPTGVVTFKDGASTLGTGTVSGGVASVMVSTLAVGIHSITASYGGDTNFNGSTSSLLSQVVNKATTSTALTSTLNPSTFGNAVTFTATVGSSAGTPPNGEFVKFMDGTKTLGSGSLASGVASFMTSALTAGTHKIKATYAGDSVFSGSSSSVLSQVVKGLPTASSVSSSGSSSIYGQTVTFTATVVGSDGGTPTGTVSFKSGTKTLGKVTLSTSGTATFATTALGVGTDSITVTYSGSTKYAASTSTAIFQTVTKATSTTAIASSVNPSTAGQSVTFTITVTPEFAGIPTGTVKLTLGTTALATVTLVSGKASYTTTTLPKGSDVIKATYGGSASFTGSSGSITQIVN